MYFPSYFVRSDVLRWLRSPETIVFLGRGLREGGLGDFFPGGRVEAAVDEEELFWWYTSLYGGEEEEERGKDLVKVRRFFIIFLLKMFKQERELLEQTVRILSEKYRLFPTLFRTSMKYIEVVFS